MHHHYHQQQRHRHHHRRHLITIVIITMYHHYHQQQHRHHHRCRLISIIVISSSALIVVILITHRPVVLAPSSCPTGLLTAFCTRCCEHKKRQRWDQTTAHWSIYSCLLISQIRWRCLETWPMTKVCSQEKATTSLTSTAWCVKPTGRWYNHSLEANSYAGKELIINPKADEPREHVLLIPQISSCLE